MSVWKRPVRLRPDPPRRAYRRSGPLPVRGALAALFVALFALAVLAGWSLGGPATAQARVAGAPNPAPVLQVNLGVSPAAAAPGQAVTFTYTATPASADDPLGGVTLDFGDGQRAQFAPPAAGPASGSVTHSYSSPQTYTVTLTVTTVDGTPATASLTLPVVGAGAAGPAAAGQGTTGVAGQPMTFTATGSTANACNAIDSYQFDFGDGTPPASGQQVSHTFAAPGTYTVTLTVTDCAGVTAVSSSPFVIAPAPGASPPAAGSSNAGPGLTAFTATIQAPLRSSS